MLFTTLLRARGGISHHQPAADPLSRSSPRTRRYFHSGSRRVQGDHLFSAHAEVFPPSAHAPSHAPTLLRARGGISVAIRDDLRPVLSSPRTRRYFPHVQVSGVGGDLFFAHAEVFPSSSMHSAGVHALLRARGGISPAGTIPRGERYSSPRTRRYFRPGAAPGWCGGLFSAHAEVFPASAGMVWSVIALLRARGGISTPTVVRRRTPRSSPRTRRYFLGGIPEPHR